MAPGQAAAVMLVLEDYLARLERGTAPSPSELLAEHATLADQLRPYLASLGFLHRAAVNLRSEDSPGGNDDAADTDMGQLGDFRLLREVGRGGMGVVYEAEQVSLRRRVALKMLPFAAVLDPRQLQRFRNEAQAAACLHHTNIVPVYYVGNERGVHFYAMQFIDGQSLADVIRELRQAAEKGTGTNAIKLSRRSFAQQGLA
jgi:serine/threonine protein kinase